MKINLWFPKSRKITIFELEKIQCPHLVSIQFIYQNEAHELNFLIFISNLMCQLQCCPFIRANWYFNKTTDQFDVILSAIFNFNQKTDTMRRFLIKFSYSITGFEPVADKGLREIHVFPVKNSKNTWMFHPFDVNISDLMAGILIIFFVLHSLWVNLTTSGRFYRSSILIDR